MAPQGDTSVRNWTSKPSTSTRGRPKLVADLRTFPGDILKESDTRERVQLPMCVVGLHFLTIGLPDLEAIFRGDTLHRFTAALCPPLAYGPNPGRRRDCRESP
jgi:hypothetical protein